MQRGDYEVKLKKKNDNIEIIIILIIFKQYGYILNISERNIYLGYLYKVRKEI